jgi:predicted ribosomally synthesized peptide with SipW-like signal peptide
MSKDRIGISRRQVLAGLGTVGVASAGAGVGTSALFSDEESFDDNSIAAGTLDLKVDWEEHYSYPQALGLGDPTEGVDVVRSEPEDASAYVGLPDPQSPMVWVHESDLPTYMENTSIESFPDRDDDGVQDLTDGDWSYDACRDGADVDEHFDPTESFRTNNADTYDEGSEEVKPLVNLDDVKPGDFGELTLSFHLCDNPGYVWLQADNVSEFENGLTEPEAAVDESGGDPGQGNGELADHIRTVWWYDSRGDNVLQTDCEEKLYLADSGTDPTTLFEVTLNDNTGEAELTELLGPGEYSDGDFDQTDAIAATPNGDEILFYDKESGHLGTYDIGADSFTDQGMISGDPGGVVLAGYAPDGTLWAASQETDELYTVDIGGPTATSQGDTGIDLSGADLVFSSDGTMYIWTANTDEDGLYRVDDPSSDPTAVPVDASNVGEKDERITGLAVRDAGTGNLVASDRTNDEIVVVDRTDGSTGDTYEMTLNGESYDYDFGDMTSGAFCGEVFRRGTLGEDLAALESGGGIPLDGNRASPFDELGDPGDSEDRECFVPGVTHYVGFAWWLPTDVGNEVQSDSVQFDLGFYTEQCRHSDGSYSNGS